MALLGLDAVRPLLLDLFSLNASPQADNLDTKAVKSSHGSKVPKTGGAAIDPGTLAIPGLESTE